MGIKSLSKLISLYAPKSIKKINYKYLENKIIAFDTSILIYQFVIAIRNTGTDLIGIDGKMTSHIHAIVTKTLAFLKKKINPIFVFDGKPTTLKSDTLKRRSTIKNIAKNLLVNTKDITEEKKIQLMKKSLTITSKQMIEVKEILKLIGIPIIESPQEADPQCAYMNENNIVDFVASEDLDLLTFGAKKLIRHINNENKMVEIDRIILLDELKLNQNEFIDLCILLGCDYCPKIDKIGMKKAYDLILKYKTIENIIENYPKIKNGSIIISESFLSKYKNARNYFLKPEVKKIASKTIKWEKPEYDKLKDKLVKSYSYQENYVDKLLIRNLTHGYYNNIQGKILIYNNEII